MFEKLGKDNLLSVIFRVLSWKRSGYSTSVLVHSLDPWALLA